MSNECPKSVDLACCPDQLEEVKPHELSPEEMVIIERFKSSCQWQQIDPAYSRSLTQAIRCANERRGDGGMPPLSSDGRLFGDFLQTHVSQFPEVQIVTIASNKEGEPKRWYRIPTELFESVVDRLARANIPELPPPNAFYLDNSVSLCALLVEANRLRKEMGLQPHPRAGSASAEFFGYYGPQFPEIRVIEKPRYRILIIPNEHANEVLQRLVNLERDDLYAWRTPEEQERYVVQTLQGALSELTGIEDPSEEGLYGIVLTMVRTALSRTLPPNAIEDVSNTVMSKLIPYLDGRIGEFESGKSLRGLIYRVCRSCRADFFRREGVREERIVYNYHSYEDLEPTDGSYFGLEFPSENLIEEALQTLTDSQRRTLELRLQGHTITEIASVLSKEEKQVVSANAVKSRLHRARQAVKRFLQSRDA